MINSPGADLYDSARRPRPFIEELRELIQFRELVFLWAGRNIKLRYKRSVLGVLWTLLEPLMLMVILTVVFSTAFRFPVRHFPIYLLSGLLLFDFFSRSTMQIVEEIISTQSLSRRIFVPRSAFAAAAVITYLVNWLIALIPLVLIMLFLGSSFSWALLTIPAGMLLAALFALGVGLVVATLGAFFQDVKLTYQVLLTALFYATPIIYPLEILPENLQRFFLLNPLYYLIATVREPTFAGQVAPARTWLLAAAAGVGAVVVGWWIFTSRRNVFDYAG